MSDKIKNIALIVLTGIVVILFIFKGCGGPKPIAPIDLKPELIRQDSFRVVIKIHDSTRLHHVTNWHNRTRITDSMPCYTEVRYVTALCDTVIKYDSILIVAQKGMILNDSVIIVKLIGKVLTDSLTIKKLNKKFKRQKLITKFSFGLGAVLGGLGGYNVKP